MGPKRMKFEAGFKLKVVEYAEKNGNSVAGRHFGINEKNIRGWRKSVESLKKLPKSKCAQRGKVCLWPDLERQLFEWVVEQRECGYIVTRNQIMLKAKKISKMENIQNFKGNRGWCDRFMKRKNLSIRQKTKIAQKLPKDLEDKITKFLSYVIRLRKSCNFDLTSIGNMDETPVWFDMPSERTVDIRGSKTILVKTTGHEKSRFTVVLTCLANGEKLRPMIIFKRKTMPKGNFSPGVVVHVHPRGWMDEEGMKIWTERVWRRRKGGLLKTKSLLTLDSFRAHITEKVKNMIKNENTLLAVIPGGLTSVLQPLDVCLNKPFKDKLKEKWNEWMLKEDKALTPGGNMKCASHEQVSHWVLDAWNSINVETVAYSFKKCGISNRMDGTEDDLLWQDGNGNDTENDAMVDDAEPDDPYDDQLNEEDFLALYDDSSDDDSD